MSSLQTSQLTTLVGILVPVQCERGATPKCNTILCHRSTARFVTIGVSRPYSVLEQKRLFSFNDSQILWSAIVVILHSAQYRKMLL